VTDLSEPDPLAAVDWPVRTERLLLRRARPDDAEATWRFRSLPAVQEWITSAPADLDAYRTHFLNVVQQAVTVVVLLDERVIGDLMVRVGDAYAQREVREQGRAVQAELGWSFDPAFGGHGYATEAVRAAIELCFGPMGLRRVVANCFAGNTASWRLMERLGMRREASSRCNELHRTRGWQDSYSYAVLRDEWPPGPTGS